MKDHSNIRSVLQNTKELCRAIQNEKHGKLASGVVLLHDDAHLDITACTRALLKYFNWELLDYPPYNPGLAPSDYHLLLT
jgi:hypothetical protein